MKTSDQVANPLRKPSLMQKACALAQYYANRDGHQWYVVRGAPGRENKIELLDKHPGPGNYETLREYWPEERR